MSDPPDRSADLPRAPRPGSAEAAGRAFGRLALLSEQTLEAKLAVVTSGDPLGLHPLGAVRLRQRFLYFDPDRVHDESAFNVVALSLLLTAEDDFDAWLVARVDEAIDNLLRRDGEALRKGAVPDELIRESGEYLIGCWGLSAEEGFEAAVRFNHLPERSRRSFFALLVEHRSVEQCLSDGLGPREELREYVVRAVEAILGARPESVPTIAVAADGAPKGGPKEGSDG